MISNEPYRTYNRPMLTKSIMADLDEEQIAVQNAGWYEEQNIQQVLDMEVVAIHPETKEIELEQIYRFILRYFDPEAKVNHYENRFGEAMKWLFTLLIRAKKDVCSP